MSPERTRSRYALEKPKHVTSDRIEPRSLCEFAVDIRHKRNKRILRRIERCGDAEELGVDPQKPPGLLIGGPPDHNAIQALDLFLRLLETGKAAVENDLKVG